MKNRCQFKIKGFNQERNLNKLCQNAKILEFQRKEYGISTLTCSIFEEKKVEKMLVSLNFEILEKKHFGLLYSLKKLVLSYGIVLGVIIGLFTCFFSQHYVLKFEINGLETITKSQVVEILNQENINIFTPKRNIKTKEISKKISHKLENVSLASVILKGNTLVVSIKEKVVNDEYENLGNFEAIVASDDAIITNIELIQGTVNVKVGDTVKKGQVLVEPYIIDSSGQQRKVRPQAKIEARVFKTFKTQHYESKLENVRTGNSVICSEISVFGLKLFSNSGNTFENYEVEEKKICISKNNILPIYKTTYVFYELKPQIIEQPFEECKEKIFADTRQKALQYFQDCDIIEDEHFNITKKDAKIEIEYVVEVTKRIDGEIS